MKKYKIWLAMDIFFIGLNASNAITLAYEGDVWLPLVLLVVVLIGYNNARYYMRQINLYKNIK